MECLGHEWVNSYAAGGYVGQYKIMQKSWENTETLTYGYSCESTQWELSNEYQHDRVWLVFRNIGVNVLWTKVASALEGLNHNSHPFMPAVVKKREMFVATQPLTFCEIFYVFKLTRKLSSKVFWVQTKPVKEISRCEGIANAVKGNSWMEIVRKTWQSLLNYFWRVCFLPCYLYICGSSWDVCLHTPATLSSTHFLLECTHGLTTLNIIHQITCFLKNIWRGIVK